MAYPKTAADNRKLALELIQHLRDSVQNTRGRKQWSLQNFELLEEFAAKHSSKGFWRFADKDNKRNEFLWDFFAGHDSELEADVDRGALFIAESEHNVGDCHDWDKLFYANAPLKIMMFRVTSPENAEAERDRYASYMAKNYTVMPAGTVFVLYGVYWSEIQGGTNRDIAYLFQVPGEPDLRTVEYPRFEQVSS